MVKIEKPAPSLFTLALHAEIRAWAGRRGFSYRRLAEESGINKNKIHRTVSSDQAALDTDEFDSVCSALEVSPKDIVDAAVRLMEQQGNQLTTNYTLTTQDNYELAAKKDPRTYTNQPGFEEGVEYYE